MSICIIYGAASSEASSDDDCDDSDDDDSEGNEGNYDRQQRLSQIQVRIQTQLRRHCADPAQPSTWAEHASSWSRRISISKVLIVFDLSCALSQSLSITLRPPERATPFVFLFFRKSYGTFTCCVMFIILVLMIHCDNCLRLDLARLGSGVAGDFNLEPSGAA